MSDEQRTTLLKQLEEIASRNGISDKRSHLRKDCLINVDVSVHGPSSSSYILDINQSGAYIETNEPFSVGQEIKLSFSAPDSGNPLTVVGKIVWTDKQGIGISFNKMSKMQQRAIRSFSDNVETVYEINS